jgi:hypothetical protein
MTARRGLLLLLFCASAAWPQGGSAIITLVMPPTGEGMHGHGGGVAVPTGAQSLFFNPALLPSLPDRNLGRVDVSIHQANLLPVLGLPGLYRTFHAVSLAWPNCLPGFDAAAGYYRNYVSFGSDEIEEADSLITVRSEESVQALGLSLRWNRLLSVGASVKFIRSELAGRTLDPPLAVSGDLGFLVSQSVRPLPGFTLRPSAGLSFLSHDFRIKYRLRKADTLFPQQEDPAARAVLSGLGLSGDLWQILEWESALDWEWDPVGRTLVRRGGIHLQLPPFLGFFLGRLYDVEGARWESHASFSLGFDLKKGWVAYHRLLHGDFSTSPESLLADYPLKIRGGWAPNFRVQYVHAIIKGFLPGEGSPFRSNQQELSLAFSL